MAAANKVCRMLLLLNGLALIPPIAVTFGSAAAGATEILPHKAFHLLLSRQEPEREETVSADGMLIFEWLDTCDGWQINQRAKLRLSGEEGETGFEWRQITWESKDGRRYRYQTEEFHDGQKGDQRRGEASFDSGG